MSLPNRKPNRLKFYDYSMNGIYFVTICAKDKKCIFSNIGEYSVGANSVRPRLSKIGIVIREGIELIDTVYKGVVKIDKYVIMPNHIHMLIRIEHNGRTMFAPTISRIVKQFKGFVTKKVRCFVWQKSFHDHIIRNEKDYTKIWEYIECNPARWKEDCLYNSD